MSCRTRPSAGGAIPTMRSTTTTTTTGVAATAAAEAARNFHFPKDFFQEEERKHFFTFNFIAEPMHKLNWFYCEMIAITKK